MSLGAVALRIASATSVIRTRAQDVSRDERHGGRNGDLVRREEIVVARLERIAEKLEKTLA